MDRELSQLAFGFALQDQCTRLLPFFLLGILSEPPVDCDFANILFLSVQDVSLCQSYGRVDIRSIEMMVLSHETYDLIDGFVLCKIQGPYGLLVYFPLGFGDPWGPRHGVACENDSKRIEVERGQISDNRAGLNYLGRKD